MKTKEEIRIEFYGEHDARAYDHDELYIMEQYAKEYHEQQVNLLNKPAVISSVCPICDKIDINKCIYRGDKCSICIK